MTRFPDATLRSRGTRVRTARPVALFLSFLLSACAMQTTAKFDSDTWKSQRGAAPLDNTRGDMLPALKSVVREGAPREDIVAALGEPDASDAATHTDSYELGLGTGVDEEVFEIRYQDGRVASSRLSRR